MVWLLYATLSSLLVPLILPLRALSSPTNITTSSQSNIHHIAQSDGIGETARFSCDKALGSPKWQRCYDVLLEIHNRDPLHFLTDWLYAPPHWEHSVLWDKTCPMIWVKDGCRVTLDCRHPSAISYKNIIVFASRIINYCGKRRGMGGAGFLFDDVHARVWWLTVSDHQLTAPESSNVRAAALSKASADQHGNLQHLTEQEKKMVSFFTKDSAKKLAASTHASSNPCTPSLAPGSPRGARSGMSDGSHPIAPGSPTVAHPSLAMLSPLLPTSPGSPASPKSKLWSPNSDLDWHNW